MCLLRQCMLAHEACYPMAGLPPHLPQYDFRVEREEVMYSRYVTLYNRKVQLPSTLDGKVTPFPLLARY